MRNVFLLIAPGLMALSGAASSAPVDSRLVVQPYVICSDRGKMCAPVPPGESFAANTYAQAGVGVEFLPLQRLNDSRYLSVDGIGDLVINGPETPDDPLVLNLWYANWINSSNGHITYGDAMQSGNGVVVSGLGVTESNREDTIAHEIGHSLGLDHDTYGAGAPDNLMTEGAVRDVPAHLINQAQSEALRTSRFVQLISPVPDPGPELPGISPVPLPAGLWLMLVAVAGLAAGRRFA